MNADLDPEDKKNAEPVPHNHNQSTCFNYSTVFRSTAQLGNFSLSTYLLLCLGVVSAPDVWEVAGEGGGVGRQDYHHTGDKKIFTEIYLLITVKCLCEIFIESVVDLLIRTRKISSFRSHTKNWNVHPLILFYKILSYCTCLWL